MTTLLYEERMSCLSSSPLKSSKGDPSDKENNTISLTTSKYSPHLGTYYIDSSGFLLDKNRFYLLNSSSQQIRLTEKEIWLLKKHALL
jgi:hypothetical protein